MEKKLQKKIIDYLNSIGAYVIKTIITNRRGVPDIIACYNGMFIAVECKSPGGRLSQLQEYNLKLIYNEGGIVFVAYDFNEFCAEFVSVINLESN